MLCKGLFLTALCKTEEGKCFMKKVPMNELFILGEDRLDSEILKHLIDFNGKYQLRILRYFAKIKIEFEERYPGVRYPGLFGEVDSISGAMRPLDMQKVWSWGDCRGLGIWSYLLAKNAMPAEDTDICGRKINLRRFFSEYCDFIYRCLMERCEINGGRIPFIADVLTNEASDDPVNIPCAPGECEPTHVFAAAGFMQYGLMKNSPESLSLGLKFLEESVDCGINFRNVDHVTKKRNPYNGHGFAMVTLGAIVDTLKCLKHVNCPGIDMESLKEKLLGQGRMLSEFIISRFCDPDTGRFWEYNCMDGRPYINQDGYQICDPGHVAEACAFIAELEDLYGKCNTDILSVDSKCGKHKSGHVPELLGIMRFIRDNGYSAAGVMYKNIDLLTCRGIYDKTDLDGNKYRTSPWWNVRECCAASIKLYEMSGDDSCLEMYKKAQNATYLNYPNEKIGGLMVQTLDADTLKPLPFHPATGNLDPMHCARAREREIEAMELLLGKY